MITASIIRLFRKHNLSIKTMRKIDIGFRNDVYDLDGKYIFKVCKRSETDFKQEIATYSLLKKCPHIPRLVFVDLSKRIIPRLLLAYHKLPGEPLYSQWHLLNNSKRKQIIRQLCTLLKKINTSLSPRTKLAPNHWHNQHYAKIKRLLQRVRLAKILPPDEITRITQFVQKNHDSLRPQTVGLLYWDVHFDNILVSGTKITGLLDFEGVQAGSIDYVLDAVNRLTKYPHLYASEASERFVRTKDYTKIMSWFKEFYPELFEFENLSIRLALYSIEYDLQILLKFPKSTAVKKRLMRNLLHSN